MIELYLSEYCPYCSKVRLFLEASGVPYITKPIGIAGTNIFRQELQALGGKTQVPFLVDSARSVQMYESDDIIAYLREHYAPQK